jgi:agmatine/peptidylarginine deiminase
MNNSVSLVTRAYSLMLDENNSTHDDFYQLAAYYLRIANQENTNETAFALQNATYEDSFETLHDKFVACYSNLRIFDKARIVDIYARNNDDSVSVFARSYFIDDKLVAILDFETYEVHLIV